MYRQKYEGEAMKHLRRLLRDAPGKWVAGRTLCGSMNVGRRWWSRWPYVSFYALMGELEDAGVVEAKDVPRNDVDNPYMMRCFRPGPNARPTLVTHGEVESAVTDALKD